MDNDNRRSWDKLDNRGEFKYIDKSILLVDESYQRATSPAKTQRIAAKWSWVSCGCIIVANRNGKLFVIDGQHRVVASRDRDDIRELPCIVFETDGSVSEAKSFIATNTERKHMSIYNKFKALVVAEDENAIYCRDILEKFNMKVSQFNNNRARTPHFKVIGWLLRQSLIDRGRIERILSIAHTLSIQEDESIPKYLLDGLWALDSRLKVPLDEKFTKKLYSAGFSTVFLAMKKHVAIEGSGNSQVYASGILSVVNKGLRTKYKMNS